MFIALPVRQLPAQALVAACCLLLSFSVAAQTPAKDGPAVAVTTDPGYSRARVQPLIYASVFSGYRTFADVPITPWRDANDLTGRIGGWRAYAREAQESRAPEATAGTAAPSMQPPPTAPQAGPNAPPKAGPTARPPGHSGHTQP